MPFLVITLFWLGIVIGRTFGIFENFKQTRKNNIDLLPDKYSLTRFFLKDDDVPIHLQYFHTYSITKKQNIISLKIKLRDVSGLLTDLQFLNKVYAFNITTRETNDFTIIDEKTFDNLTFKKLNLRNNKIIFEINKI